MNQSNVSQRVVSDLEGYEFGSFTERLKFFHHQLVSPLASIERQSELYLKAGCKMFACQEAFLAYSNGAVYRTILVCSENPDTSKNTLSDTQEEIYRRIVDGDHISEGEEFSESAMQRNQLTYNRTRSVPFFGAQLSIGNRVCGAICFFHPFGAKHSSQDIETLEMMAEGVARMIEIQSAQDKNRIEDVRGFAAHGVKSLDEYMHSAKLPEVYGVSGRVVEVLQRRIGLQPLGIDHIAEELNLSKRTLQRRLQQQNVSFAQLRDQVRFHFSIDFLVKNTLSIDSISAALDFSDRTSFTNAFKRWTALSSSTFRKLFRDYV